jgi:uncharacterized membrane protein
MVARRSFGVLVLLMALGLVLAGTVIGLITLWPKQRTFESPFSSVPDSVSAEVTGLTTIKCAIAGLTRCQEVLVELRGGPDAGTTHIFSIGQSADDPELGLRDRILVSPRPQGSVGPGFEGRYTFVDFDRSRTLIVLAVVFAVLVLLLSRWQGLRSLVGVLGSLLVIIYFVVPAILDGGSPVGVALVGALVVMFLTIPLTHGIGLKTVAACLGTATSLVLTLLVADLATTSARLTGLASEEGAYLRVAATDVSLSGLLVAGMVIAALGVLDDLTVSQSSTVFALRAANPTLSVRELFSRGLVVGRDHMAATVNTLVLAYAGASLPILLIFSLGGWSFRGAVTSEVVAAEVVAAIVGSIGLIAAVPVTTGLAAFLASRMEATDLEHAGAHAH